MCHNLAKSRRKSWAEIHHYYRDAVARCGLIRLSGLRDFSHALEQRADLCSLVTVGNLGCVFVYRDADCDGERGFILIGGNPMDGGGEIRIGFSPVADWDSSCLMAFS